jgi:hypothetical protein
MSTESEKKAAAAAVAKFPKLYAEFERLAVGRINAGHSHYGSRDIIGYMRWHTPARGEGAYKIDNNLATPFAIHFATLHADHGKFFRRRYRGAQV